MSKAKVPNLDGFKSINHILMAVADSITYLKEQEVPERYWQEKLRWYLVHDLKEPGTLKEKQARLDEVVRGITEEYVLDKEGLSA